MATALRHALRACGGFSCIAVFAIAHAQNLPPYSTQSEPARAAPRLGVPAQTTPSPTEQQTEQPPLVRRAAVRMAGWRIHPRVLLSETYSDNIARSPDELAQSGWVSLLSPGVRLEGGGARVQGFFDYQRNEYRYARRPDLDSGQNQLNASGTIEAIEQWLFVDGRARILQVNRSPFGPATTETTGANPNRAETSVVQLSPYVRGALGTSALYVVRFNAAETHADQNVVPDTAMREWIGRIRNTPGASPFGWALDGSRLSIRNASIGEFEDSRVRGSLMYAPSAEVRLAIYGGTETQNSTGTKETDGTPGAGIEWAPGGRTQVAAVAERRFFGTGHSITASHRTPLTALKYTDNRDVSSLPGQLATGGQSSVYGLLSDLLATSVRDPVARDEAVRTQLERTGAAEYSPASVGFLNTTGATIAVRRQGSLAVVGRTNTLTFIGTQNQFQPVGSGDLGLVGTPVPVHALRQSGYSASWAHRLSPLSSVTLLDAHLRTHDLTNDVGSRQHAISLTFLTAVGRRTSFSVGGRRVKFESEVANGYSENAAVLTAALRF